VRNVHPLGKLRNDMELKIEWNEKKIKIKNRKIRRYENGIHI